ncbi:MAG: helix-turn-helix transcriptional regulator [Caulobacterales bacterium]|nr:helix-turn-helix transcriptional regulator [Caulobacterales bacterium]
MSSTPVEARRDNDLLSQALKLVRRHRGMTAAEVARAMHMALRTYERFEAGGSRLNIDYVHRFALATNSDPYAIIMAVAIASPELAPRCADNKLITILTVGSQRFDHLLGDRIHHLEGRAVIAAVCDMFDELVAHSDEQELATRWLMRGAADLSSTRPKPGR